MDGWIFLLALVVVIFIIRALHRNTSLGQYYIVSLITLWFLALIFFFHFDGRQLYFNHSDSGKVLPWVTIILGIILWPSSLAAGLTGIIGDSVQIAALSWLFYSVVQVLILGGIVSEKSEFQVTSIALKFSLPLLELLIAAIQYLGKFAKFFS